MTSFAKFSLAVAVAGMTAISLGSAETGNKKIIIITPQPNMSCPVGMRAQHGVDGSMRAIKGSVHSGSGQKLQLTLKNGKLRTISAVRITLHGWDGTGRALPTVQTNSSYANATRTVDLKVSIGPGETIDTDVWANGLTAVDSIDLDEVSYADGLSWRSPAPQACSVAPDPEMLISER